MHLPNKHPLLPLFRITQQDRRPIPTIPRPPPHPPNQIRLIKVIILLAIRVQFPGEAQIGDFALRGGREPVVRYAAAEAVDVAVEDAGVAGLAEED